MRSAVRLICHDLPNGVYFMLKQINVKDFLRVDTFPIRPSPDSCALPIGPRLRAVGVG